MQLERIEQPHRETDAISVTLAPTEEALPTLAEWQAQPGQTAVALSPDDDPSVLRHVLGQLSVIAVAFPNAADGRGFTIGRTLRDWGFDGELRATGGFVRDQLHYLRRCGFNAFDVPATIDVEGAKRSLFEFSVRYQTVHDKERPLSLRMR